MRRQRGDQLQPAGQQLGAVVGQVLVPDREGGQVLPAGAADLAGQVRRAEQGVALLDDPVVVGADPGVPGLPGDQQVVEVAAAFRRVAADQLEVLGGEQHHPQGAEHVARAADRGPVEPGPVGLAGHDLQLDQQLAAVVDDLAADHRGGRAGPDQGRVGGHPVAVQGGHVAEGLDQVGLAHAVLADQHGDARVEIDRHPLVRAEVGQLDPAHIHHDRQQLMTAWPPNCWRSAATAFMAGESICRDSNRANSDAAMTCSGTARRTASSTVQRPSPVSSA